MDVQLHNFHGNQVPPLHFLHGNALSSNHLPFGFSPSPLCKRQPAYPPPTLLPCLDSTPTQQPCPRILLLLLAYQQSGQRAAWLNYPSQARILLRFAPTQQAKIRHPLAAHSPHNRSSSLGQQQTAAWQNPSSTWLRAAHASSHHGLPLRLLHPCKLMLSLLSKSIRTSKPQKSNIPLFHGTS